MSRLVKMICNLLVLVCVMFVPGIVESVLNAQQPQTNYYYDSSYYDPTDGYIWYYWQKKQLQQQQTNKGEQNQHAPNSVVVRQADFVFDPSSLQQGNYVRFCGRTKALHISFKRAHEFIKYVDKKTICFPYSQTLFTEPKWNNGKTDSTFSFAVTTNSPRHFSSDTIYFDYPFGTMLQNSQRSSVNTDSAVNDDGAVIGFPTLPPTFQTEAPLLPAFPTLATRDESLISVPHQRLSESQPTGDLVPDIYIDENGLFQITTRLVQPPSIEEPPTSSVTTGEDGPKMFDGLPVFSD